MNQNENKTDEIKETCLVTEVIRLIDSDKNEHKILALYDLGSSHSGIDYNKAAEIYGEKELDKNFIMENFVNGKQTKKGCNLKVKIKSKDGIKETEIFAIPNMKQLYKVCTFEVPSEWKTKYDLIEYPKSAGGLCTFFIGLNMCHLLPKEIENKDGVVIYESRITGNLILGGKVFEPKSKMIISEGNIQRINMSKISCNSTKMNMSRSYNEKPLNKQYEPEEKAPYEPKFQEIKSNQKDKIVNRETKPSCRDSATNTEPKTTLKITKEDNGTQTEQEIDIKFEKEIISKDETDDIMTLHDEKFILDKETHMKTNEIKIFNEPNKMKILYDQRKLNEQEKKIRIYKTNNCFSTNMLFVFISVACVVFASFSGSYPQTNIKENTEFTGIDITSSIQRVKLVLLSQLEIGQTRKSSCKITLSFPRLANFKWTE